MALTTTSSPESASQSTDYKVGNGKPDSGFFQPIQVTYPTQALQFLEKLRRSQETDRHEDRQRANIKLSIIVVGAGLGGLATAVALATQGHSVVVLEQALQLAEVGAGIQIPPNSARLLERWKVMDHLRLQAVTPDSIRFRRWRDGEVIAYTKLIPDFEENFGSPYYVAHRADLHNALYKRALELGVQLVLDSRVVEYRADGPSVQTANGRNWAADLVVAADGVKSTARDLIVRDHQGAPRDTGFAVYRATVDVETMKKFPELEWMWKKPGINIWIGEDRHIMTYCISGGRSFNLVLSHRDATEPASWEERNVLQEMRAEFADWDPQIATVVNLISQAVKWPLRSGGRLSNWVASSSKLLILGDAAHAMVPYMSQGAAMAIEDGAALATILSKVNAAGLIPEALMVFEKERIRRTGQMQDASMNNGVIWHYADGPEQQARDAAMHAEVVGCPFSSSANQWSDPVTQFWAYGYDAERKMEEAWGARKGDASQLSTLEITCQDSS